MTDFCEKDFFSNLSLFVKISRKCFFEFKIHKSDYRLSQKGVITGIFTAPSDTRKD